MKNCKNGDFRHISGILAGKKISLKIELGHVLNITNAHLCGENQKNLMMKSRENAKKPGFPVYFRHFRPEMDFFSEIDGNGHCHFASLCQKSAKTNEPISRKAGNRRTNG